MFLERSGARAINSESLNPPNPNCPVCSLLQVRVEADPDVATVNDLVEGVLRMELGYGKDITVTHGSEEIYVGDGDLDDNLEKKLSHFGIGQNSFLTVTDYSEEDARVDIEIIILGK